MKNFGRVLRVALRNRFTIAGIFFCSLIIAVLWGANIGMIYPVVEIISQGDSTHKWIDNRVEETEKTVAEFRGELAELHKNKNDGNNDLEAIDDRIGLLEGRLSAEEKALATQQYIRPYVHQYLPDDPFHLLVIVIAFLLMGTIAKNLALFTNAILVAQLREATLLDMRRLFFQKLLDLDIALYGKTGSGKLIRRIMGDVSGVIGGISLLVGKTLREPLKLIVCLFGACFISWRLLLFSLLLAPPTFFLMTLLAKSIRQASRQLMEESAEFYQRLTESFSSISIVKAFTMENYQQMQFDQGCGELYRKSMKSAIYKSLVSPINELLGFGVIGVGLLSGGYLVLRQETHLLGFQILDRPMGFGPLIAFYGFLVGVSDPARKLSGVFTQIQSSLAAADRVYELLDTEPQVADPKHPKQLDHGRDRIVFDGVSFHYSEDEPVLRSIDLTIDCGESLAIVGPNGCGKSTLVNLILRFYDPIQGAIRNGDLDLREVRQRDLRRQIGLVTQETMLFDDTIMSNIRFGSMDASDEEVIEAAKKAHAHQFVENVLEQGYQTNVGHGGNRLSAGQRQRIALSRAILRDPDILILDEATSQIDPESEQAIHQALKEFINNRTAIMITHRMSTLDLADRILVMNEGRILDIGSHDELIARCDIYRRLRQSSELRKSA